MIGQERHPSGTLPQSRHMDVEHVETIKKILAKPFLFNRLFQIFIGRRDDPNIDADILLATDPSEGLGSPKLAAD